MMSYIWFVFDLCVHVCNLPVDFDLKRPGMIYIEELIITIPKYTPSQSQLSGVVKWGVWQASVCRPRAQKFYNPQANFKNCTKINFAWWQFTA